MKNLKSILLGLSLVLVLSVANAAETPVPLTKNYAINTYIDAVTRGKLSGINDVLDASAKFSITRGKGLMSFSKKEMIDNLKVNQDVEMECTTKTSVVENTADYVLVKVDMKFDNSTRADFVTMVNTAAGWKITNIHSVVR